MECEVPAKTKKRKSNYIDVFSFRYPGIQEEIMMPPRRKGSEKLANRSVELRIMKSINIDAKMKRYDDNYCLLWIKKTNRIRVGCLSYIPKNLVYNMYNEELNSKERIDTICGNSNCIQPLHLTRSYQKHMLVKITKELLYEKRKDDFAVTILAFVGIKENNDEIKKIEKNNRIGTEIINLSNKQDYFL